MIYNSVLEKSFKKVKFVKKGEGLSCTKNSDATLVLACGASHTPHIGLLRASKKLKILALNPQSSQKLCKKPRNSDIFLMLENSLCEKIQYIWRGLLDLNDILANNIIRNIVP
jgi:hypothetical protein